MYPTFAKYEPLKGSAYTVLLKVLADKKEIINVKHKYNECLKQALNSATNPANHIRIDYQVTRNAR